MSTLMDLRQFVGSKVNKNDTPENLEMCAGLGLLGEMGEFCDLIKKEDYHGKPCPHEKKLDELGDILFYFQNFGGLSGTELDEILGTQTTELNRIQVPTSVFQRLKGKTGAYARFVICLEMVGFAAKWVEAAETAEGERWYKEPAMRLAFGYFLVMVHHCNFTLEEVFQANVKKMNARYPNGFEKGRAHGQGEGELTYSREAAGLKPVANEQSFAGNLCEGCGHPRYEHAVVHGQNGTPCHVAGCSCVDFRV